MPGKQFLAALHFADDSLGEGVQSAIASDRTQPHVYLNLIAQQMNVAFPLPLLSTTFYGVIGNVSGRARENPDLVAADMAVSGADSTSILTTAAQTPPADETDLVLEPQFGLTQISAAEASHSPFTICWIGANDVLGAILAFDDLNATQITPVPVFQANYDELTSRLAVTGSEIVYANIPDVTQIAFLFGPEDLALFLGSSYGLPEGSYTTLVAMLLIRLGLEDPSILQDPNWVLDPTEIQTIHNAVVTFNGIIAAEAAEINVPVVDVYDLFNEYTTNPPVIGGVTLTPRFLGGVFSLDGVHPSDIGHALLANAFIGTIDEFYGLSVPTITTSALTAILDADPFIDFKGTLQVRGRPLNGLLETLGPHLGISGDFGNLPGASRGAPSPGIDAAAGRLFMRQYFQAIGKDPNTPWTSADAVAAMRYVFHLPN
jgi:phospholipase/lecithinase/hemolysin